MKTMKMIALWALGMVAMSCSKEKGNEAATKADTLTTEKIVEKSEEDKSQDYLITRNSVGRFKIGGTWRAFAKNVYGYDFIEGYGICVDACCDGGYSLGNNLKKDEYGFVDEHEITIGAAFVEDLPFDATQAQKEKYKNNPNLFSVSSDNCGGWYEKDKIQYMVVHSPKFKTQEGIGVGTTLEELEKKYGKLKIFVGWVEEDANAIKVLIPDYPNIGFAVDAESFKKDWEEISIEDIENKKFTIADFKPNTPIARIVLYEEAIRYE